MAEFQIQDQVLNRNALSKSFNMAGWRVGMLAGSEKNINAVLKVKSNMDSGMFYPVQVGAVEALRLSDSWFVDQYKIYTNRKEKVLELISTLNCEVSNDQAGLFVWAKTPEGKSSDDIVDDLLYNKDIFITPGFIFGSQGEGYIRFSLCANEENISEALKRVKG